MKLRLGLLVLFLITTQVIAYNLPFDKVVIWGHKLHSHTHSYIHWGFYRAFKHLGYETHWLDQNDSLEGIDCSKALFITEGQVDSKIPILPSAFYIVHNCEKDKYRQLFDTGHAIILQVYTHDVLPRPVVKLAECIYYSVEDQILYMPWATDLLPEEIEQQKAKVHVKREPAVYFVGTVGGGYFGNQGEVNNFKRACSGAQIQFKHMKNVSMEENIKCIQNSYIAPAIQGEWQVRQGYIPCRIFKNISYGQWGVTNSKTVHDLFEGKVIYHSDCYQLFFEAQNQIRNKGENELIELMDLVRDKHTYLNRIDQLLYLFEKVYAAKNDVEA